MCLFTLLLEVNNTNDRFIFLTSSNVRVLTHKIKR